MSAPAIKFEMAAPAVAGVVGFAGLLTEQFFLLAVAPAILGSAYSVHMSWQRNRQNQEHPVNWVDFVFGFISAAIFGVMLGWWLSSMMPGDSVAALPLAIFVCSLWGTKLLRSLHKTNWDFGAWLKGIFEGVAAGFQRKPDE